MSCCGCVAHCEGVAVEFSDKVARRDLKRYRKRGPDRTTRILLDALRAHGVEGATLLDVGAGIGAIHHELLDAGVRSATHVDAAPAYVAAAKEEVERRGHSDRVSFRQGDFVTLAGDIPPADIVTLDRVICCYPDMERLVAASTSRARRMYGVVYPRALWWVRASFAAVNLYFRLRRSAFRTYVHPTAAIDGAIRHGGLAPLRSRTTLLWYVAVYGRADE